MAKRRRRGPRAAALVAEQGLRTARAKPLGALRRTERCPGGRGRLLRARRATGMAPRQGPAARDRRSPGDPRPLRRGRTGPGSALPRRLPPTTSSANAPPSWTPSTPSCRGVHWVFEVQLRHGFHDRRSPSTARPSAPKSPSSPCASSAPCPHETTQSALPSKRRSLNMDSSRSRKAPRRYPISPHANCLSNVALHTDPNAPIPDAPGRPPHPDDPNECPNSPLWLDNPEPEDEPNQCISPDKLLD